MDGSSGDCRLAAAGAAREGDPVSRSCRLEDVSFGAFVEADGTPRVQWAAPNGFETVGCGCAARFTATGDDRFECVRDDARAYFERLSHEGPTGSRPRAFGGFSFHDGHEPTGRWAGFEAASFVVPRVQVTRTATDTWLTVVAPDETRASDDLEHWRERIADMPSMRSSGTRPGVTRTHDRTSKAAWTDRVETALEAIDADRVEKVVLAQTLAIDLDEVLDVPATLERLRRRYPNCYRFAVEPGVDATFFGAPPERLVAKTGDRIETEALAGSIGRGETPAEDDELAETLLEGGRFEREHGLVVEAICEQLESLTTDLTVGERTVRRLATIQHLQTPIESRATDGVHVLDVVGALHPTPAVGGLDPEPAWETIREVEPFDRGWYAAPIGWFDGEGDGEFAVGIRSGLAAGDRVTLFAGNGIVADSDPAAEWREVQLKFRPILDELE